MRFALIDDATGIVLNVVEIVDGDGSTVQPGQTLRASDLLNIGDLHNKAFTRTDPVTKAALAVADPAKDTKGIAVKVKAFTDQKAAAIAQTTLEVG